MFMLPKAVCNEIESLMARFLWAGTSLEPHKTKVAWKQVTKPKCEGGLNLCRITTWNKAAIMKNMWHILTEAEENIWTSWARKNLLKGKTIWYAKIPDKCSWNWRKILALRHLMKQLVSWRVGDGSRISFWWDAWRTPEPLIELFGEHEVKRAGLPTEITVHEFLATYLGRDNQASGLNRHAASIINRLRQIIPATQSPSNQQKDKLLWNLGSSGKFSVSSAYAQLRDKGQIVAWHKFIWFPKAVLRFAFIAWMVMLDRLPTNDRFFRLGVSNTSSCQLCGSRWETIDHLFFSCSFSRQVWDLSLAHFVPNNFPRMWSAICRLVLGPAKHPLASNTAFKRGTAAAIYYVWMERNLRRVDPLRRLSPTTIASFVSTCIS